MRNFEKPINIFKISIVFSSIVFILAWHSNRINDGTRRLAGGVQVVILPEQPLYDGTTDIMDDDITKEINFEEQEILKLENDMAYHIQQKEQQQQQEEENSSTAMKSSALISDIDDNIDSTVSTSTTVGGYDIEKQKALNHAYDMARAESTSTNFDALQLEEQEILNHENDMGRNESTSTNSEASYMEEQEILNHEDDMAQGQSVAAKQEEEEIDEYFHDDDFPFDDDIARAAKQEQEQELFMDNSPDEFEMPVDDDIAVGLLDGKYDDNLNSAAASTTPISYPTENRPQKTNEDKKQDVEEEEEDYNGSDFATEKLAQELNFSTETSNKKTSEDNNVVSFIVYGWNRNFFIVMLCIILVVTNLIAFFRICCLQRKLDAISSSIRSRSGAAYFSIFGRRSRNNREHICDNTVGISYSDDIEENVDVDAILAELETKFDITGLHDDCKSDNNNHYLFDPVEENPGRIASASLVVEELSSSVSSQQNLTRSLDGRRDAHVNRDGDAVLRIPNRSYSTGTIRKKNEVQTTII